MASQEGASRRALYDSHDKVTRLRGIKHLHIVHKISFIIFSWDFSYHRSARSYLQSYRTQVQFRKKRQDTEQESIIRIGHLDQDRPDIDTEEYL